LILFDRIPSVETPGYFQSSLRDGEGEILVALSVPPAVFGLRPKTSPAGQANLMVCGFLPAIQSAGRRLVRQSELDKYCPHLAGRDGRAPHYYLNRSGLTDRAQADGGEGARFGGL
jgi:hypothetical protein